jgi:hypothetical protein
MRMRAEMPGLERVPPDVRTVHLGQFTPEHADAIAEALEKEGIVWWAKIPGFFSRIWEFGGVHVFVDRAKLDEARAIADRIAGHDR